MDKERTIYDHQAFFIVDGFDRGSLIWNSICAQEC